MGAATLACFSQKHRRIMLKVVYAHIHLCLPPRRIWAKVRNPNMFANSRRIEWILLLPRRKSALFACLNRRIFDGGLLTIRGVGTTFYTYFGAFRRNTHSTRKVEMVIYNYGRRSQDSRS